MSTFTSRGVRVFAGSLAGAVAIHVALVACSDSSGSSAKNDPTGEKDSGLVDAIVDALTNLVESPPAKADPVGTTFTQIEVHEQPCDVVVSYDNGTGTTRTAYWAVHAFAGIPKADLAKRLVSIGVKQDAVTTVGNSPPPPGFGGGLDLQFDQSVVVTDGSAAIQCGGTAGKTAIFRLLK